MNDYLQHYGVVGMKWGIRRARRKEAKATYKNAKNKALKKYEKDISSIEKKYKRGQLLSKKDAAREEKVDATYQRAVAKAKAQYKQDKKRNVTKDTKIANKLYPKQSKETNKRVVQLSTGKALAQSYLMGTYGALKYNEARVRGESRGKAAVKGLLANANDFNTAGLLGNSEYLENRMARK